MKFPILIKKNRVFVWYYGHWINIHLMAQANGDGLKGYYRFFKGWIKCIFGHHSYSYVFRMSDMKTQRECSYCWKEKEIEKSTMV
jgi:hypothetical protein